MVAHAVAKADGTIQEEERRELHDMVNEWAAQLDGDYDITEIIFSVLKDQQFGHEERYSEGMKNIRLGDQYLTESMKEKFIFLMEDIARAFPPITPEELDLLRRFKKDLTAL